jgi:hypothetical protein
MTAGETMHGVGVAAGMAGDATDALRFGGRRVLRPGSGRGADQPVVARDGFLLLRGFDGAAADRRRGDQPRSRQYQLSYPPAKHRLPLNMTG